MTFRFDDSRVCVLVHFDSLFLGHPAPKKHLKMGGKDDVLGKKGYAYCVTLFCDLTIDTSGPGQPTE